MLPNFVIFYALAFMRMHRIFYSPIAQKLANLGPRQIWPREGGKSHHPNTTLWICGYGTYARPMKLPLVFKCERRMFETDHIDIQVVYLYVLHHKRFFMRGAIHSRSSRGAENDSMYFDELSIF